MDGRTDERTENLPILQDFVPYRGRTNGRVNGRTDGKSPHSTGLCPLPGPLPCFNPENLNPTIWNFLVKQGKGTADHLVPLGGVLILWAECLVRHIFVGSYLIGLLVRQLARPHGLNKSWRTSTAVYWLLSMINEGDNSRWILTPFIGNAFYGHWPTPYMVLPHKRRCKVGRREAKMFCPWRFRWLFPLLHHMTHKSSPYPGTYN